MTPTKQERARGSNLHLGIHYATVFVLYMSATYLTYLLLSLPDAHRDLLTSLASAAILATLGSAIAAVGSLWTGDRSARVTQNVDILYKDILKQPAWRRWPFLLRSGSRTLLDGGRFGFDLRNPMIPLNVGSHHISVLVPTVQEDFFDLPLFSNVIPLLRFRSAAHTTIINAPEGFIFEKTQLGRQSQYMVYECLTDIWLSILIFRFARYVVHFGAALTISSAIVGAAAALASAG
jgi:hypothetical protein